MCERTAIAKLPVRRIIESGKSEILLRLVRRKSPTQAASAGAPAIGTLHATQPPAQVRVLERDLYF
jgi:hypothetical protein